MATFNAGAIEASLTLDRSAFSRELRMAKTEARNFEKNPIEIDVRLRRDAQLTRLEQRLKRLDTTVNIDAATGAATAKLKPLETQLKSISGHHSANIDINIDNLAGLVATNRLVKQTAGVHKVTMVNSAVGGAGGGAAGGAASAAGGVGGESGRALDGTRLLIGAVVAGLPLIPPLAAAATVAVGGLFSALMSGAGGAAVGVMAAIGAIKHINDAMITNTAGAKEYRSGMDQLKGSWTGFIQATASPILGIMGSGLQMLAQFIPRLIPVFNAMAPALQGIVTGLGAFINGPEMAAFLGFLSTSGPTMLGGLMSILGNLALMFMNLAIAFAPVATIIIDGLQRMTAGWASGAGGLSAFSGPFQAFIDYGMANGPLVLEVIKGLWNFAVNLGVALAPIGTAMMGALGPALQFLGAMDPAILGAIVVAVGLVVVAIIGITAAMGILNIVMALNPFVLITVAVIAFVAALIYLWNTSDGARAGITVAFQGIHDVTVAVVTAVIGFFTTLWVGITTAVGIIGTVVSAGFNVMRAVILGVVGIIVAFVTSEFLIMRTIIETAVNIMRTLVGAAFQAMQVIVGAVVGVIRALISGNFGAIPGIVTGALSSLGGIATAAFGRITSAVQGAIGQVRGILGGLYGIVVGAVGNLGSALHNAGVSIITGLVSGIQSAIGRVKSVLGSVTNLIPSWKGPPDKDATLLTPAGSSIMGGLIGGIESKRPALKNKLGQVTRDISLDGTMGAGTSAGGSGRATQVFYQYITNPIAEPASQTAQREQQKAALL